VTVRDEEERVVASGAPLRGAEERLHLGRSKGSGSSPWGSSSSSRPWGQGSTEFNRVSILLNWLVSTAVENRGILAVWSPG